MIGPRSVFFVATSGLSGGLKRSFSTTMSLTHRLSDPSLFRQQCYLDGRWEDAASGKTLPVLNPASGETIGNIPDMGAAETRRAIEAAARAWPAWRAKTGKERGAILRRWFELIRDNQEDLAIIMTAECAAHAPLPVMGALGNARSPTRTLHPPQVRQTAPGEQGRDHLRRIVCRVVWRGGEAHLWRRHPKPPAWQACPRDQPSLPPTSSVPHSASPSAALSHLTLSLTLTLNHQASALS